jgi:YD repeat-containing protein
MLSALRNGTNPRYTLSYTYDALGRRIAMNDNLGASTTYAYDRADRLTAVTAPSGKIINLDYDDAGRHVGVRYPNGLSTTDAFETPVAANCSSAPPLSSSGTTSSLAEAVCNTGRLASIAHGQTGANTGSILNLKLGTFAYGYDVNGNITGITESGAVARIRNYTLDPLERLTSVKDASNANIETYTLDGPADKSSIQ